MTIFATDSIYARIKQAWADHMKTLPEGTEPWNAPPHIQAKESIPRQLDLQLTRELREPIAQFQDGLISATEFVDKVIAAAASTK